MSRRGGYTPYLKLTAPVVEQDQAACTIVADRYIEIAVAVEIGQRSGVARVSFVSDVARYQ